MASSRTVQSDVKFFVPDPARPENESFHIIEFDDEPVVRTCYEKNPNIGLEYTLAAVIVAIGVALISIELRRDNGGDRRQTYGLIFLASGGVGASTAVFSWIRTRGERGIFKQADDYATVIYLACGIGLLASRDDTRWKLAIGSVLFDAGLVNFLLRSAYLARAAEDENRDLRKEVEMLRDTLATGISDNYFGNFIKHVARNIAGMSVPTMMVFKHPDSKEDHPLDDIKREVLITPKIFYVIIPRKIDWTVDKPFDQIIEDLRNVSIFDCHFPNDRGPRPKWIVASCDPRSTEESLSGICMDVAPTTMQGIVSHIKANVDTDLEPDEQLEKMKEQYLLELNKFSKRLAFNLRRSRLNSTVRVIEFEVPTTTESLREAIQEVEHQRSISQRSVSSAATALPQTMWWSLLRSCLPGKTSSNLPISSRSIGSSVPEPRSQDPESGVEPEVSRREVPFALALGPIPITEEAAEPSDEGLVPVAVTEEATEPSVEGLALPDGAPVEPASTAESHSDELSEAAEDSPS